MGALVKQRVFFRTAIAMAFLSVFAFVAPPVAVAFVPAKDIIDCLTQDQGLSPEHLGPAIDNKQSDTVRHEKHPHGDANEGRRCCRIFCVMVLAPETYQVVRPLLSGPKYIPVMEPSFHSRPPESPLRPPNPGLSI